MICWAAEAPPLAFHSMFFAHVFFACLENQGLIVPEVYAIASHLTRTYCGRVDVNGKVIEPNLPRLISAVPGILPTSASIPPYVHREDNLNTSSSLQDGASVGAGPSNYSYPNFSSKPATIGSLNANYSQLRMCAAHAEVRLMLTGLYDVLNAHCMAHLCESFRALLIGEVRCLKLISIQPCTSTPAYLPPGSNAVKCEVRTATGIPFTVMLAGPSEALSSRSLVQYALRTTVTADAQAFQLKLPPPGATLPCIKSHPAVAGGAHCIETMALTSTWAIQVLKNMCRNARSRTLVSLGVAAVSNHPTTSFSKFDGKRFMSVATGNDPTKIETLLKTEELAVMPGSVQKKPRVMPPMPVTAAEAAATAAAFAAAAAARAAGGAPQQGNRPVPAVVGGAKTPALEGVAPRPPSAALGHQGLPPLPRPFPAVATGPIPRIIAAPANPITNAHAVNPSTSNKNPGSSRAPIDSCTEAIFMTDLITFLQTQLKMSIDPSTFPEISLNGSKLDVFTLYREVCRRGGYAAANRIDWKNGVFPWMKNFTSNQKLTAVGNLLKLHYTKLLLEYEKVHPEDVQRDGCVSCGDGGAGGGDGMCSVCRKGGFGRSGSAAGERVAGDALVAPMDTT